MNLRTNNRRCWWLFLMLFALAVHAGPKDTTLLVNYSNNLHRAETHLFAAWDLQTTKRLPQAWAEINSFRVELKTAAKSRAALNSRPGFKDASGTNSDWPTFRALTKWHDKLSTQDAEIAPQPGSGQTTTVAPMASDPAASSSPSPLRSGIQPSASGSGASQSGNRGASGAGPGPGGSTGSNPGLGSSGSTNDVPLGAGPASGYGIGPGGSTNPTPMHPVGPGHGLGIGSGVSTNVSTRSLSGAGTSHPGIAPSGPADKGSLPQHQPLQPIKK